MTTDADLLFIIFVGGFLGVWFFGVIGIKLAEGMWQAWFAFPLYVLAVLGLILSFGAIVVAGMLFLSPFLSS